MTVTLMNTVAHSELKKTEQGIALVAQSKADALRMLFGDQVIELEREAGSAQSEIFDAIRIESSLCLHLNGVSTILSPRQSFLDEKAALQMLADTQSTIEHSLLTAMLQRYDALHDEYLPGATVLEVVDLDMQELIGEYETPDEVEEWRWVERESSFGNHRNGEDGIWEFVLNLNRSLNLNDAPGKLKSVVTQARREHATYILFHQGT